MNTKELKKHIQDEIEHIDDQHLLEDIGRLIDLNTNEDIYRVHPELKEKLIRSDRQIDTGNSIDHQDLKQRIDQWLSE